ncbi:MAG TPA: hypothetical protein VJ386_10035 [Candidatus Deferrimicrobiaceae bacterium]|nr:hypothetical protein [Candidatus Deferrimicrobiaceae bacterium]
MEVVPVQQQDTYGPSGRGGGMRQRRRIADPSFSREENPLIGGREISTCPWGADTPIRASSDGR